MITNPLTVKQIKLQELSLGDIHSFCIYFSYMNDCLTMYKHMSSHIFCMTIIILLIQNVKLSSVWWPMCAIGKSCRARVNQYFFAIIFILLISYLYFLYIFCFFFLFLFYFFSFYIFSSNFYFID